MDFKSILKAAEGYKDDIAGFLRDMISIPSESADEKKVIQRIKKEMEDVGIEDGKAIEVGSYKELFNSDGRLNKYYLKSSG
jgi:acetylornithine deacetylase/succinyl-diaminopimelate desuccinylase-like protein